MEKHKPDDLQLLWGAREISAAIGRSLRATFAMLEGGHLPAKKVGGRWVANRADLVKAFRPDEAA